MNQLTIVGMGPGSKSFLTMEAYTILTKAKKVYLRTEKHPVVEALKQDGMVYEAFDCFYEQGESFEETYEAIVETLLKRLETEAVVYAVPGNAFVAEETVSKIMKRMPTGVTVIHGVSFIDAIVSSLKMDPVNGLGIQDALRRSEWLPSAKVDTLWIQVYNQQVASEVKLTLMPVYGDDHEVKIIKAAGIPGLEEIIELPLCELDREAANFDHLTSLYVPKPAIKPYDIYDLLTIMKTLRGENGCPWDREQTHDSLTPFLIEEAYEVKHAVVTEDDTALVDELGDVLLQVVFHANLGEESGYFDFSDVVRGICEKMVRRHPHVFGSIKVDSSEEVLVNWQAIKDEEKAHVQITESMKAVPTSFPALIRSHKIQKRASAVGFDWASPVDALDKIIEEVLEVKEALKRGDALHLREELGDLLLIVSNVVRMVGADSEEVLNEALDKFVKRFAFVEEGMAKKGLKMVPEYQSEMELLWECAKK